MENNTTINDNDGIFYGRTDWYVKWKFDWKTTNGLCKITRANTNLSIKYTMPKIPKSHKVKKSVRSSFNKYYNSLLKHEKNHMTSGLYAAREIKRNLLKLSPFKSCKKLESTANAIGKQIIAKYRKRDKAYDIKTNHGETEGVSIDNFI